MRPLLEELAALHRSELDFTAEAVNLREVSHNLARRRVTATLPSVVDEVVSVLKPTRVELKRQALLRRDQLALVRYLGQPRSS